MAASIILSVTESSIVSETTLSPIQISQAPMEQAESNNIHNDAALNSFVIIACSAALTIAFCGIIGCVIIYKWHKIHSACPKTSHAQKQFDRQKKMASIAMEIAIAQNNQQALQKEEKLRYSQVAKKYMIGMYKEEYNDNESDDDETDVDEADDVGLSVPNNRGLSVWSEGPTHLKLDIDIDGVMRMNSVSMNECAEGNSTRALNAQDSASPTLEGDLDLDVDDIVIIDDVHHVIPAMVDMKSDGTDVVGEDMDVDDIQL